ncbi:MAG: spirocyclase AveC family protein [Solirubrobacteraceae bacterium]
MEEYVKRNQLAEVEIGELGVGASARITPASSDRRHRTPPIVLWAVLGAVMLAFILWVWARWLTGPYFRHVSVGPDQPPMWMRIVQIAFQAGGPPAVAYLIYRVAWKPWRRERIVSFDALMLACWFFMWFWDVTPGYTGMWWSYNTSLVNMGSWVYDMPGWVPYAGTPGHMVAEPLLIAPLYMTGFFGGAAFACLVMRRLGERFPRWDTVRIMGACFVVMMVFDLIVECFIWMPAGLYTYAGAHVAIFPSTYHKYPVSQMVFAGAAFTGWASLRHFKNDRGETLAERGLSEAGGGFFRQTALRFLALLAAMSTVFLLVFALPDILWVAPNSTVWPEAIQDKSYFTDGICGKGTDRICPGPGVPIATRSSAYLNTSGQLVVPRGTKLQVPVVTGRLHARR